MVNKVSRFGGTLKITYNGVTLEYRCDIYHYINKDIEYLKDALTDSGAVIDSNTQRTKWTVTDIKMGYLKDLRDSYIIKILFDNELYNIINESIGLIYTHYAEALNNIYNFYYTLKWGIFNTILNTQSSILNLKIKNIIYSYLIPPKNEKEYDGKYSPACNYKELTNKDYDKSYLEKQLKMILIYGDKSMKTLENMPSSDWLLRSLEIVFHTYTLESDGG